MAHLPDFIRDQATAIIAAAFGAFLSLPFMRDARPYAAVIAVFSGVGCAYYFTPWIAYWLNLSMQAYGAIAFIMGFSGMMLLAGAMRLLEGFASNPTGLFSKIMAIWRGKGD